MKLTLRTVFALISVTVISAGQTAVPTPGSSLPPSQPVPPGSAKDVTRKDAMQPETVPVSPPGLGTSAGGLNPPQNSKPKANKGKGEPVTVEPPDDPASPTKPYVIGSLDVLQISVWDDPKLSGIFDVRPDGMISMPLIGEFKGDGLTVNELTAVIKERLSATVKNDPEVNVQVAKINSKKFFIYGGCLRQGEFPLVGTVTVMDAFANCGGFRDFANTKKIYILRGSQQLPFNYKEVSKGKHLEQNRRLQNGDRIFVPE